jgi:hypothetical protein
VGWEKKKTAARQEGRDNAFSQNASLSINMTIFLLYLWKIGLDLEKC